MVLIIWSQDHVIISYDHRKSFISRAQAKLTSDPREGWTRNKWQEPMYRGHSFLGSHEHLCLCPSVCELTPGQHTSWAQSVGDFSKLFSVTLVPSSQKYLPNLRKSWYRWIEYEESIEGSTYGKIDSKARAKPTYTVKGTTDGWPNCPQDNVSVEQILTVCWESCTDDLIQHLQYYEKQHSYSLHFEI